LDFRLTPDEQRFQEEVREFIAGLPPFETPRTAAEFNEASRKFDRLIAERGWQTMAWPSEYGGKDATIFEQLILIEAAAAAGIPWQGDQAIGHLGPVIMLYGTDEQKETFLPMITRGELRTSQGFSERNAGSDLAGLELKAVRDGDAYVMNGSKIWIAGAQFANYMHFMARTGEQSTKHRGISYFLTRLDAPGITIRPIEDMRGQDGMTEVIMEDVRVPVSQRIGDENQGWYVATTGLNYQRSSIASVASTRRFFDQVLAELGSRAWEPRLRAKTAQFEIELTCARLLSYRVAWMQSAGFLPLHEASIDKVFITELQQRITNFAIMALGPRGQLTPDSPLAPLGGAPYAEHIDATTGTIGLGSSEIQRTVIANKGLGMPR